MILKNYKKLLLIISLVFFSVFYFSLPVFAQDRGQLWQNISEDCLVNGNCQLNDMLRLAVNVANIILKYMGIVALVLFIYGGILWITSGGSQDRIKTGRDIVIGALIGIVLIVSAYLIVTAVMKGMGAKEEYIPKSESNSSTFLPNNFHS